MDIPTANVHPNADGITFDKLHTSQNILYNIKNEISYLPKVLSNSKGNEHLLQCQILKNADRQSHHICVHSTDEDLSVSTVDFVGESLDESLWCLCGWHRR